MTWKRTLALIVSVIWIAICAVSVFAQDLVAAPARVDIRTVPALAFDDLHLAELLKIDMAADATNFVNPVTAVDTLINASASADFMHEVVVLPTTETNIVASVETPVLPSKQESNTFLAKSSSKSLSRTSTSANANSNPSLLGYRKSRAFPASTK
jgi:hypothetical protein